MRLRVEPLGKSHDRASFRSGTDAIDDWFARRAGQDVRRNVTRVFVAIQPDEPRRVLGFYSLSAFTLSIDDLPDGTARGLPRYDAIPAALIGRLARDAAVSATGMGGILLADAVRRILGAAEALAVFAIVVEAKDDRAAAFYRAFGFRVFPLNPKRLFLPVATARAALQRSDQPTNG